MSISGLSDFDSYSDKINDNYSNVILGEKTASQQENNGAGWAKIILASFQLTSSGKSINIAPMSGSVNVSVEKDPEGDTSATADITISNDNSHVKGEVSVDQDGNVSGKVEVGISWDN